MIAVSGFRIGVKSMTTILGAPGGELRRSLTFANLVTFGLVSMGPVAAFTMFGFVHSVSGGAIILSSLLGAAGLTLTALSFAQMASVAPQAGSVYGYAKFAIGGTLGFLGGWALLLDYLLLGSLTAVYGALYLAGALPWLGEGVILWVLLGLLLVTGVTGVTLSSKLDIAVMLLQLGFALVFSVLAIVLVRNLGQPALADVPLGLGDSSMAEVLGGASLAVISFLGFDAISTLAEEVKGDRAGHAIGRATILCVMAMLGVFLVVSWLLAAISGGIEIVDPATAAFEIMAARLPALATPLAVICGLAVGIGSCQACHTGSTRLIFAMARDGRLPSGLARISPAFHSPLAAVFVTLGIIAAGAMVALDHVDVLAGLISFGALTGFVLVNLSVLVHFGLRQGSRNWLRHWLLPMLGIAVLVYIMSGINPLALEVGAGWLVVGVAIHMIGGVFRKKHAAKI